MKIGVVGCGAVGSFYGGRLAAAGEEVHFLLRSDFATVSSAGLWVRGPAGDLHIHPLCARTPEEIGVCDLVLVALKSTANAVLATILPPLVGPSTAVLTLQNGLGNEQDIARVVHARQILGGLCFVCLNRIAPGVIRHLAHGRVTMGEFLGGIQPRTETIARAFRRAGVECVLAPDLALARWEKLVWNIPFNGLGIAGAAGLEPWFNPAAPVRRCAPCLTTEDLLGSSKWERIVLELMREVIVAADALGLNVPPGAIEENITRTRGVGAYKPSTVIDFEMGRELELDSLFVAPLRAAANRGAHLPRMETLCRALESLATRLGPV